MMSRAFAVALLVAAWSVLALAGCGDDESGSSAGSRDDYERDLKSTMQQLDKAYPDTGPAANGTDLPATRAALADAADKLDKIQAPAEFADAHEKLVEGVRGMAEAVTKLEQAQQLATSDPARASELTREVASDESFREVTEATEALEKAGVDTGA